VKMKSRGENLPGFFMQTRYVLCRPDLRYWIADEKFFTDPDDHFPVSECLDEDPLNRNACSDRNCTKH
jgi:hypothetical protein